MPEPKLVARDDPNIEQYPTRLNDQAAPHVSIGDMHGNALKLIYILIEEGVLELKKEEYERLMGIYYKSTDSLDASEIEDFKRIINNATVNTQTAVTLIGDELADRGKNDYFTLLVLQKLHNSNVDLDIMISNHSAEFIREFDTTFKGVPQLGDGQGASLVNMHALLTKGLIKDDDIRGMVVDCYIPRVKAIGYTMSKDQKEITLFTHAPVGLETVEALAKQYDVPYLEGTAIELRDTIDAINKKVREHFEAKKLTAKIEDKKDNTDETRKPIPITAPFRRLIWNRLVGSELRTQTSTGLEVKFVHGHVGSDWSNYVSAPTSHTNLDNDFGKHNWASNQPYATRHSHELTSAQLLSNDKLLTIHSRLDESLSTGEGYNELLGKLKALSKEEILQLLKLKDTYHENILFKAMANNSVDIINIIFGKLDAYALREIFNETNTPFKDTLLHKCPTHLASDWVCHNAILNKLTDEQLDHFLKQKNADGDSILHISVRNNMDFTKRILNRLTLDKRVDALCAINEPLLALPKGVWAAAQEANDPFSLTSLVSGSNLFKVLSANKLLEYYFSNKSPIDKSLHYFCKLIGDKECPLSDEQLSVLLELNNGKDCWWEQILPEHIELLLNAIHHLPFSQRSKILNAMTPNGNDPYSLSDHINDMLEDMRESKLEDHQRLRALLTSSSSNEGAGLLSAQAENVRKTSKSLDRVAGPKSVDGSREPVPNATDIWTRRLNDYAVQSAVENPVTVTLSPRNGGVHNQQGVPLTSAQNTPGTFSKQPHSNILPLPNTEVELKAELETAFETLGDANKNKGMQIAGDKTKGYEIHNKSANPALEVKITPQQVVTATLQISNDPDQMKKDAKLIIASYIAAGHRPKSRADLVISIDPVNDKLMDALNQQVDIYVNAQKAALVTVPPPSTNNGSTLVGP